MLLAGSRLINAPILGLQTGSELARTERAIINPRTLEIVAYEVNGPLLSVNPSLIRIADVREFSDIGLIIDSSDEFVAVDDIIKLHEIYELQFNLTGMAVLDKKRKKLGKVDSYTLETTSFTIQQISVKRPLWKSFAETELLIHRTQIIEITDDAIVVEHDGVIHEPVMSAVKSVYSNPFRKNNPIEHGSDQQQL